MPNSPINPDKKILQLINNVKKNYRLQQIVLEFAWFLQHVQQIQPHTIIEIGTASGASTICLSHFTKQIISVDCRMVKNREMFAQVRKKCKAHFIEFDTKKQKCFEYTKARLNGRKADVLFIDGDHSYRGVKRDFNKFSKLVRKGGIVAIHDITKSKTHVKLGCKVYKFWDEIKDQYESYEMTLSDWGGIGIVKIQ